jgi:hypothetical protein
VIAGGLHPIAVLLLLGAWAVFAAFLATLGLWWSMVARTTLRATLGTLITTALLAVGHWLPWMCCGAFLFMGSSGAGLEILFKLQAGLTPPAVLVIFAFYGPEFTGANNEVASVLAFSVFGLCLWVLATVLLGGALSQRFRIRTGRSRHRYPDRTDLAPRPHVVLTTEPRLPLAAAPAEPAINPQGAILVAETWEKPRPTALELKVPEEQIKKQQDREKGK